MSKKIGKLEKNASAAQGRVPYHDLTGKMQMPHINPQHERRQTAAVLFLVLIMVL